MSKLNVMNAVERLEFVFDKVEDFDELELDLSDRVLENRIITLEVYLKFLNNVGIPTLEDTLEKLEYDI